LGAEEAPAQPSWTPTKSSTVHVFDNIHVYIEYSHRHLRVDGLRVDANVEISYTHRNWIRPNMVNTRNMSAHSVGTRGGILLRRGPDLHTCFFDKDSLLVIRKSSQEGRTKNNDKIVN
jgi:hypothetical protein